MNTDALLMALIEEGYSKKTWHGPNLLQSIKGISAEQAAWRPAPNRHNIWELTVHAAYWKYAVRRKIEGGKRGSFVLKGSNFFARPEEGKATEAAWKADSQSRWHGTRQETIAHTLRSCFPRRLPCGPDSAVAQTDGRRQIVTSQSGAEGARQRWR
jgi:hypothetical protein